MTPEPGPEPGATVGVDGVRRCPWAASTPEYRVYHDTEWGRAVHGDSAIFERITLEAFQSGLSWLTILRKRENFRKAFGGFDIRVIADYTQSDCEHLLCDTGIVRNRAKIEATVANARAVSNLLDAEGEGALDILVWSFAPVTGRVRPRTLADVPASSPESLALARELKGRGLSFVGPTTMYAAMQAMGVIDDHLADCDVRADD